MSKAKIILVVVGVVLIVSSFFVFNLYSWVTISEETETVTEDYPYSERYFWISKNQELTFDFKLINGEVNITIRGRHYGDYGIKLNESYPTKTIRITHRYDYTTDFSLAVTGEGSWVKVHIIIREDKFSDNALAGTPLLVTGSLLIALVLLSFRKVDRTPGAHVFLQVLGLTLVFIGLVLTILFLSEICTSLVGVALIFIGVELILVVGKRRDI